MKKKFYFLIFFIILFSIIYLNSKSYRYVGNNYIIEKIKISNFQKLSEFYKRHLNYQKLVKKITKNSKNKSTEIIDISTWVYKNIKKISDNDDVIDNHPYTIVERNLGTPDQFSDLLSVLLVYINIDSFFTNNSDINDKNKPHRKFNPVTFFKYKNEWSIIDPYYGVYFINNDNHFATIEEIKDANFTIRHLTFDNITILNIDKIFFDKNFMNITESIVYYKTLLLNLPNSKDINDTHIYERGGRSYIQKPLHRILQQLKRVLNI